MDFKCKSCGGTKSIDFEKYVTSDDDFSSEKINYKVCISCDEKVIWREKFKKRASRLSSRDPIVNIIEDSKENLRDLEDYIHKLKYLLAESWELLERASNQDSDLNLMKVKDAFKQEALKIEELLCLR